MVNPDDLLTVAAEMQKPMELYLQWRQVFDRLERGKNTVLGQIMKKLALGGEIKSAETMKLLAHADEVFVAYLAEMDKAEKNMVKAKIKFDNLKNQFDAIQSAMAYQREEMRRAIA